MKVYIYEYVNAVTSSWHSGGGLVIVSKGNPQDAWDEFRNGDTDLTITLPEPSKVYTLVDSATEEVIVFPDAGCC